jgi:glycogen debranching enzyme
LTVRPEGPTLTFASDSFTVNETWLAPTAENGAILRFEISTWKPLEIEACFTRDFQLMWPAGLGGTYMSWDEQLRAFTFGEEGRKFAAIVGSPSIVFAEPEVFTNSYQSTRNMFRLQAVGKGTTVQYIFIAGSVKGPQEARKSFDNLVAVPERFFADTHKYYEDYLSRTLTLELPDRRLQTAYDWSRISTIQGLVLNPFLGTGLVAGYGASGTSGRPGYAWFFGRDSLWTDLALDVIGDFRNTKTALEFIAKFQRDDGKIEHEISQTASLVDWWGGFPYGFASADATPLFLIATNDYVKVSGDIGFAREHWDNLWRAYQFLRSTYDAQGLARNRGVGHGWVEGGPLLPVESESYQSGLAAAALKALASLAQLTGKPQQGEQVGKEFEAARKKINEAFWDARNNTVVFALERDAKQVQIPTVLSTAPMWFDVFDPEKVEGTIDHIASWDHSADWGMRIISQQHPLYGPTGYHFGSVWPLFTGWASVAEYEYHRPLEAYANLRANSLLALDGSLGRVTEVLSGTYYEGLGTSSPHQVWSSAMVISPLVRGLFGLSVDENKKSVHLAPHLPAEWNHFAIHHLNACGGEYEITFRRDSNSASYDVRGSGGACTFEISPAFSKHARILGATFNGTKLSYTVDRNSEDQHATVRLSAPGKASIRFADDFGLSAEADLPPLGSESGNLKIFRETWGSNARQLTVQMAGVAGRRYALHAVGAHIASVSGGELKASGDGSQSIEILIPAKGGPRYVDHQVTVRF